MPERKEMLKFSYRKRRIFRVLPTNLKLLSNFLDLTYLAKITSEGSDMTCTLKFIEKKTFMWRASGNTNRSAPAKILFYSLQTYCIVIAGFIYPPAPPWGFFARFLKVGERKVF